LTKTHFYAIISLSAFKTTKFKVALYKKRAEGVLSPLSLIRESIESFEQANTNFA
jgi:hypothetical protein